MSRITLLPLLGLIATACSRYIPPKLRVAVTLNEPPPNTVMVTYVPVPCPGQSAPQDRREYQLHQHQQNVTLIRIDGARHYPRLENSWTEGTRRVFHVAHSRWEDEARMEVFSLEPFRGTRIDYEGRPRWSPRGDVWVLDLSKARQTGQVCFAGTPHPSIIPR